MSGSFLELRRPHAPGHVPKLTTGSFVALAASAVAMVSEKANSPAQIAAANRAAPVNMRFIALMIGLMRKPLEGGGNVRLA